MVMSFNSTINHRVVIENSEFADNSAVHNGGGVYITMFQDSKGNRVIIRNSIFTNNSCFLDGGAISMHVFEITNDNLLWVEDSTFEGNAAWVGGGACAINLQVSVTLLNTGFLCSIIVFNNIVSVCFHPHIQLFESLLCVSLLPQSLCSVFHCAMP